MTTALVPADNMAALEALTTAEREVTHMLTEARDWLAHAKEATGPAEIATFRAQMATVAEATKQLNLSKEIQLDAQEMVRRAERGVGVAIREGQRDGTVRSLGDNAAIRDAHPGDLITRIPSVKDIAPDFYHNGSQVGHLTDGVTDDQFEEAVVEAKSEGNLSRANVVRKIRQQTSPPDTTRATKSELIAKLASRGYASRQMVNQVGVAEDTIRDIAREFNIEIPADKAIGKAVRINSTNVVRNIVTGYENAQSGESAINWSDVDPAEADEWIDSLITSIGAARAFIRKIVKIRESIHV